MIDYLILTHNIAEAKTWYMKQQPNSFVLDETELALLNPIKFSRGFLDVTYSDKMVEELRQVYKKNYFSLFIEFCLKKREEKRRKEYKAVDKYEIPKKI